MSKGPGIPFFHGFRIGMDMKQGCVLVYYPTMADEKEIWVSRCVYPDNSSRAQEGFCQNLWFQRRSLEEVLEVLPPTSLDGIRGAILLEVGESVATRQGRTFKRRDPNHSYGAFFALSGDGMQVHALIPGEPPIRIDPRSHGFYLPQRRRPTAV